MVDLECSRSPFHIELGAVVRLAALLCYLHSPSQYEEQYSLRLPKERGTPGAKGDCM